MDFQRTISSWHNQLVLLTGAFQQLGSIVGGVLINAFKPFIQALNSVMGAVINFAQVVSDALGAIFGWEYQVGGGVANDYEAAAGAAEDLEDATGGAAKKAKELNRYIAAWHEVNNMTSNDGGSGGGSGGGGGAGGAGGTADGGEWIQSESLWEKYTSDIDSLYELGDYIQGVLTDAMNSIRWDDVYESARNFGSGLASFLNGLLKDENLFSSIGTTIAGSLNTVLHGLDSFGQTFSWINFGESIAAGINSFFDEFDFTLLASTLNTWANGLLDSAIEAVQEVDWEEIGTKIGEFLEDINFTKILRKVGKLIWEGINASFDTYKKMFETAPLETALLTLVGVIKLLKTTNIVKFVTALGNGISIATNFGKALAGSKDGLNTLYALAPKTAKVVDTLKTSFGAFVYYGKGGQWSKGFQVGIQNITENLTGMQKGVITAISAFAEFNLVSGAVENLATGTGDIITNLGELASGAAIGAAGMYVALGPAGLAIAAIDGIVAAFDGVHQAILNVAEDSAVGQFSDKISDLADEINSKTDAINSDLESIVTTAESSGTAQANMARDLAGEYEKLKGKVYLTKEEQTKLKDVSQRLVELVPELSGYINEQTGLLDVQDDTLSDLIDNMELYAKQQGYYQGITDLYSQQAEAALSIKKAEDEYNDAFDNFISNYEGMSDRVKNMFKEGDIQGLRDLIIELQNGEETLSEFGVRTGAAAGEMVNLYEDAILKYKGSLDGAKQAQDDVNSSLGYMWDQYNGVTTQIQENRAAIDANKMSTDEYKQSLKDVNTEFQNIGVTLSDEFSEKIALLDFDEAGTTEKIIGYFDKLKSQVQLSSEELTSLFSLIAPGISNEFIASLSNEESNIQLQIATTLGNMASGAEVSSEELKQVFSTIGYDLPDETIRSFSEKESSLQTATLELLSKINNGYDLSAGNLKVIFDTLGIDLPSELISSIEDMESDTQEAAIELLAQIKNASDSEKQPLIDAFNELGGSVIDDGIIDSMESSVNQDNTKRAVEGYLNKGIFAVMTEQEQIANNSGSEVGKELVSGVNSGIESNKGTSKGVIGNWVSNLTGWFKDFLGIASPSKVFREFGGYTVQGFNDGLENNFGSSYQLMNQWADGIASAFNYQKPALDLSIDTSQYQFKPIGIDPVQVQGKVQESLQYAFASSGIIDYNRLGQAVYQAQSQAMQENPVQFGDDQIFNSARRAQQRFLKRTGKIGWSGI